jgi:hypothetical protein
MWSVFFPMNSDQPRFFAELLEHARNAGGCFRRSGVRRSYGEQLRRIASIDRLFSANQRVRHPSSDGTPRGPAQGSDQRPLTAFDARTRARGRIGGPAQPKSQQRACSGTHEGAVPNRISAPPIDTSNTVGNEHLLTAVNGQRERNLRESRDEACRFPALRVDNMNGFANRDAEPEFLKRSGRLLAGRAAACIVGGCRGGLRSQCTREPKYSRWARAHVSNHRLPRR